MRLLLVEDDPKLANTLIKILAKSYVVEWASTGEDGDFKAYVNSYDLIILDLGLADISGKEICRKIRDTYNLQTPILILTSEYAVQTKVELLNLGADDYLVKPFQISELEARIRSLIRRHTFVQSPSALNFGELTLNTLTKQAFRKDKQLLLRRKEFDLLEYMMRNPGTAITRDKMLEHVWDSAYEPTTNTVDVHIKCLRERVDKDFEYKMIQTVRGTGYKLQSEYS